MPLQTPGNTAAENTGMALFFLDNKQYCVYMNEAAEQMTGFALNGIKEKQLHYYIQHSHPDGSVYPIEACPIDMALPANKQMTGEEVFVHRDGSFYPVAFTASPILVEGKAMGTILEVRNTTREKKEQQALVESERRFRYLIQSSIIGVFFWDLDGGIVDANQTFLSMLGYTQEDLKAGLDWRKMTLPQWKEADEKGEQQFVATGQHPLFEKQFLHKDQHPVDVLIGSSALEGTGNRKGISFVLDITEQKKAEAQVKEQLELTCKNVPSAIYQFDKAGKMLYLNEMVALLMGYASVAEVLDEKDVFQLQKRIEESFDVKDEKGGSLPVERSSAAVTFQTGKPAEVVAQFISKKEGTNFWIRSKSEPVFDGEGNMSTVLTTTTDITEQKQAEDKIRESEAQFRDFSNNIQNLAWMADGSGWIYWYNQRWYDYTGTTHEDMQGWGWGKVHHPGHIDRVVNFVKDAWKRPEPFELTFPLKGADGKYQWFLTRCVPVLDAQGTIYRWIGTNTNINEQVALSEKLEALVEERTRALQRSNEDLQQFAHVASHDLKEPVRKIMIFINRLKHEFGSGLPEKAVTYLSKVEASANRMYAMIDGVLLYSSLDALEQTKEEIDLKEILHHIESDLEVLIAQKEATIEYGEMPLITGSGILLYQLFYNLLNNSLKFSSPDRKPFIVLTAAAVATGEVSSRNLPADREYVKITLQDNGIGFNNEKAEKIFVTFTRLHSKDKFEGTGLGLSLCKKIVERHGGGIAARGNEGAGAVFELILPVA